MNLNKIIVEEINEIYSHQDYLKWKRDNVMYRGIKEAGTEENGGGAMLGQGLYTAYLSNKSMAKGYGTVYFVVGAKAKHPKLFKTLNDWEIWFYNTLVYSYSKAKGKEYPDRKDFDNETTIKDELIKMGYDGIAIVGREMVNFTPNSDEIRYFSNENQLMQYYEFITDDYYKNKMNEEVINENTYKVYHGTNNQFNKFSTKLATHGIIWFTDSIDSIKSGDHGGNGSKYIMTRYITINNPAGWDEYEKYGLQELEDMGYDGVILPQGNITDYFVFSTKNIKVKP